MRDKKDNSLGKKPGSAIVVVPENDAPDTDDLDDGTLAGQSKAARQESEDNILRVPLTPWSAATDHARVLLAMRQARKRKFFLHLAVFVGLPTLLTVIYVTLLASPNYVSDFKLTYQTFQQPNTLAGGLVQSLAGTSQLNNTVDIGTIITEYIGSPALLTKLDQELGLRKYFSNPNIDRLSRLSPGASHDAFLAYYQGHISASEGLGGYVSVSVRAFDPNYAQALAQAIVKACDNMVDDMTARTRKDEMAFAEAEATRQEERVQHSLKAITDFQNTLGDQDPQRLAAQLGGIVGTLETDLASARTQLASAAPYLKSDSPLVIQMKSRITSLEQQLQHQQNRLANTSGNVPYSQILAQYTALQLEQEFAKSAYLAAQQGLASARADAARKQNYVVDFSPPSEPDKPDQSQPLAYVLSVFLGALLTFAFGSLVVGAFRDQAGV